MRDLAAAAARPAALEQRRLELLADDAHAGTDAAGMSRVAEDRRTCAPAKATISAEVVTSVAHTRRPSARFGSSGSASARTSPARTPASSSRRWTVRASGTRTANSLRYGPGCSRSAPTAASAASSSAARLAPERRHVAQPVRADGREVDRGGQGEERLVGADVAGRLVAPDVLLARAHGHHEGALPVEVGGHPDEAPGDLADERVGRGQDPEVRPAVLRRDPERLALAGRDVGAVRAGRLEDGQADRLDDGDEQRARGVRQAADLGHRLEQAEEVGLGGDDAGDRAVRVGEHPLEGGQVGRAGGSAVGDQRDLVELEAALEDRSRSSAR